MAVLVSSTYGDYPLSCWEIINTSMGLFVTDRTSKVDLTRGGGDEPVVIKATHGR